MGDGNGNFTLVTVSSDVKQITDIDVGDVDGDGDLDIVSISSANDAVYWHENNGNGTICLLVTQYLCDVV